MFLKITEELNLFTLFYNFRQHVQQPQNQASKIQTKQHPHQQPPVIEQEMEQEIAQSEGDSESDDESWNSEDDPDRLWCICKQPHNNR